MFSILPARPLVHHEQNGWDLSSFQDVQQFSTPGKTALVIGALGLGTFFAKAVARMQWSRTTPVILLSGATGYGIGCLYQRRVGSVTYADMGAQLLTPGLSTAANTTDRVLQEVIESATEDAMRQAAVLVKARHHEWMHMPFESMDAIHRSGQLSDAQELYALLLAQFQGVAFDLQRAREDGRPLSSPELVKNLCKLKFAEALLQDTGVALRAVLKAKTPEKLSLRGALEYWAAQRDLTSMTSSLYQAVRQPDWQGFTKTFV